MVKLLSETFGKVIVFYDCTSHWVTGHTCQSGI